MNTRSALNTAGFLLMMKQAVDPRLVPGLQPGIAPRQETYGVAIGYSVASPLALNRSRPSRSPSLGAWISVLFFALGIPLVPVTQGAVSFSRDFSPQEGVIKAPEQPCRQELCLNGLWQFQPMAVPKDYKRNQGVAPELTLPQADAWSETPIKIPSPWNINTWGTGQRERKGPDRLYWPDSVYFPSYPAKWDHVQMGWLRRSFRVPGDWNGRRIILHFEAVGGDCQVLVNGRKVTEHFDTWLPFEVDVTEQVRMEGDNELLVGVRHVNLFNKASDRYPKFLSPYPPGSQTESLAGIWQDVFLLALPPVRVADTFVKPLVNRALLEMDLVLVNDSQQDQTVQVGGEVYPWINQAGRDVLSAPEPKWKLGEAALSIPSGKVTIKAGQKTTLTLRQAVAKQLSLWSPKSPNLYGLVVSVKGGDKVIDRQYTRFGWRELTIHGSDVWLNGEKVQMMGDFVHPFGPFIMSRRYVWAYYQMIKDFGGNSVRPHAQIHPRVFLEMADEMGLMVLAETSVFGSSIKLNPDEPIFWERYAAHYDGMIQRDRNHPCVMGWSFGNEMFAIPLLNKMTKADVDVYHGKLMEMGRRSVALEPTRTWISCDGDEDLNGSLAVWSKHYGHGRKEARLPKQLNKPMMVGESGGTYYATPEQLSEFNGDRAFESYLGRNEALAIDLYDNMVNMALPNLAYFSASEIAWFGLEHLNFGYSDYSRLPTLQDGVFCVSAYQEGKPGMQLERIPPYVTTINPGWDPSLPLYKPLPMFLAMKAALASGGPQPCPWDHIVKPAEKSAGSSKPNITNVEFSGSVNSPLRKRLAALGVPMADGTANAKQPGFLIVDGQTINDSQTAALRSKIDRVWASGGTVLLMVCDATASTPALNALLPEALTLTDRHATMLQPRGEQTWAAGLGLKDLYFANSTGDRQILKCGLAGPLVEKGRVVLEAGNIDWALFNNVPENAKAGAVVLYEHLQKPSGAALVRIEQGKGTLVVCSIDYRLATPAGDAMWRKLLGSMGLQLGDPKSKESKNSGKAEHDLLLNGPVE